MPNFGKYLLGNPPFRFLAGHLAQDDDFINDARSILKLDQDAYRRLSSELGKSDAFLSSAAVKTIVREAVGDTEKAEEIAAIISRLGRLLHDADMPTRDALNALSEAIEEKAESLEPKERQVLIERIRVLAAEPVGLARQQKARQLVDATSAELDEFRLIYDIRPIFDESRERIEGAIPLAVLHLEFSERNGDSGVVEVRITEKQIADLEAMTSTAKRKLNLIKQLLASHDVSIPATKATVTDEDDDARG